MRCYNYYTKNVLVSELVKHAIRWFGEFIGTRICFVNTENNSQRKFHQIKHSLNSP